ncbi:hypothetical protein [Amycolatopsis coloradensis]|nr:hypothetical protein [Amycolatopsis coloradensis]
MDVESMDDVADCLLSVAWKIFPLMGKPPGRPETRAEEIRSFLVDACHGAGMRAREWAAAHGTGTETDHRPFLRLAEVCADANLYLGMVSGVLVVDPERVHRRWAEIEALVHEARGLAESVTEFLDGRAAFAAGA